MIRLEVYEADGGYQIREIASGLIEPFRTLVTVQEAERYLACIGERRYVMDGRVFLIDEAIRQTHWNAGFRIMKPAGERRMVYFQTRTEAQYGGQGNTK